MTHYFSYIANADDPDFQWDTPPDGIYNIGNLPRRLVPAEAHSSLGISIFWIMNLIKAGRYEGKQIDWGAWAIKLSGAELMALWDETPALMESVPRLTTINPACFYFIVAAEG